MNFSIILFILAIVQIIRSEIPGEKQTPPAPANTEVTSQNKIIPKIEEISAVTEDSTPVEIKVFNDAGLKQDISDLNKRQLQQDLFLKRLLEDVTFIKRSLTKIANQNTDWTVIQRRQDGSEDFYRSWNEYKKGFGNTEGEFFIGLDNLHEMTSEGKPQELLIIMEDFEQKTRYAKYDKFKVASEDNKYAIEELGTYSGNAGDSMRYHRSRKFSTKDQDNDNNPTSNCAKDYKGGWWFDNCYSSHLNGPYYKGSRSCRGGINWYHWHNYMYSLKYVEMMIRDIPDEEE